MSSAYMPDSVAKVSVLNSGQLLLNGNISDLAAIETEFQNLQKNKGAVWYYRENARAEPSLEARTIIQLIIKYRLPISMSSKADFSDYIDDNGASQLRQPSPGGQ